MVGAGFARMAANDPSHARVLFDSVLDNTPDPIARRDIARGMSQSMPQETMQSLCGTRDGCAMLERARAELQADPNEWASAAVDSTLKGAGLKHNEAFKALDPESQRRVTDRIGLHWANTSVVDSTIALAQSPGFQAATPGTRKEMLSALEQTSATGSLGAAKGAHREQPLDRKGSGAEGKGNKDHLVHGKHLPDHWHHHWSAEYDPGSQAWSLVVRYY
jgi:hypothetical protein